MTYPQKKVTAKERAEGIKVMLFPLVELGPYIVEYLSEQIKQAETLAAQEAWEEGYANGIGTKCDKHNSGAWWCSTCSIEDLEKQKAKGYASGAEAMRERAAKLAESMYGTNFHSDAQIRTSKKIALNIRAIHLNEAGKETK